MGSLGRLVAGGLAIASLIAGATFLVGKSLPPVAVSNAVTAPDVPIAPHATMAPDASTVFDAPGAPPTGPSLSIQIPEASEEELHRKIGPPLANPDGLRLFVVTPEGLLLVDFSLVIRGKTLGSIRGKLIDEILGEADSNGDGRYTWQEAQPRLGVRFSQGTSVDRNGMEIKKTLADLYDANKDGLVDRPEVQRMLGGWNSPFNFMGMAHPLACDGPDPFELLDSDKNRVLSPGELAQAPQRLKTKDRNFDEALEASEFKPPPVREVGERCCPEGIRACSTIEDISNRQMPLFEHHLAHFLNEQPRLLPTKNPTLRRALFAPLDRDGNGALDFAEVLALTQSTPAHLEIECRYPPEGPPRVVLKRSIAELTQCLVLRTGRIDFELARYCLRIDAAQSAPEPDKLAVQVDAFMAAWDKNKDGYLDPVEVGQSRSSLTLLDLDRDGKVFAAEYRQFLERGVGKPSDCQLWFATGDALMPTFSALDENEDQRLSLREIDRAAARLREFDTNGDGSIAASELPRTTAVTIGLGDYAQRLRPAVDQPAWFTAMDRNFDGDVSPREFLGSRQAFDRLDTDHDQLLSPSEGRKGATVADEP